jgi:hypothetical protein
MMVRPRHLALLITLLLAPLSARAAGACDQWLSETVQATGAYQPTAEAYSRPFVFAMQLDCNGTKEQVTVQRPTGNLPVCQAGQPVEVVGRLIWNRTLVDGHYEINDPQTVNCR